MKLKPIELTSLHFENNFDNSASIFEHFIWKNLCSPDCIVCLFNDTCSKWDKLSLKYVNAKFTHMVNT